MKASNQRHRITLPSRLLVDGNRHTLEHGRSQLSVLGGRGVSQSLGFRMRPLDSAFIFAFIIIYVRKNENTRKKVKKYFKEALSEREYVVEIIYNY